MNVLDLMRFSQMSSTMLYKKENNPIIWEWHSKVWLKSQYDPDMEEYSGDSPKIVNDMLEHIIFVKCNLNMVHSLYL